MRRIDGTGPHQSGSAARVEPLSRRLCGNSCNVHCRQDLRQANAAQVMRVGWWGAFVRALHCIDMCRYDG